MYINNHATSSISSYFESFNWKGHLKNYTVKMPYLGYLIVAFGLLSQTCSINVMVPKTELSFVYDAPDAHSSVLSPISCKLGIKVIENFAKKFKLKIKYFETNKTLNEIFIAEDRPDNITHS